MPSVINEQPPSPTSPPQPRPSMKPTVTRLHIPADQEMSTNRLNQALPPIPPSPSTNLAPPSVQRPPRTPPTAPPAKPTRTLSHPVMSYPSLQLPPTVPEENPVAEELSPVSPLRSPVMERDSANSRYSLRRRASTSPSIVRRNSRPYPDLTESSMDEEAQRYAEEIRKKRESRRRWKEAEDEDRVIIGNKVDMNHPNYITAYSMLTGLRVAV